MRVSLLSPLSIGYSESTFISTFIRPQPPTRLVVCLQVDRIDTEVKERLGGKLTDDHVGYANCSLVGNSQVHIRLFRRVLDIL
jgi:hypothetical protein